MLPPTPREPYWICTEASFACLVMQTTNTRAWDGLKQVARRADVGLRMEILNRMNYSIDMKCKKWQRIDFLAEFLDDSSVPDTTVNPELFEGINASHGFSDLSVQNLAAKELVRTLGIDVKPEPAWTATQWAQLRERVRRELKRD
jgi:hypothetical protein